MRGLPRRKLLIGERVRAEGGVMEQPNTSSERLRARSSKSARGHNRSSPAPNAPQLVLKSTVAMPEPGKPRQTNALGIGMWSAIEPTVSSNRISSETPIEIGTPKGAEPATGNKVAPQSAQSSAAIWRGSATPSVPDKPNEIGQSSEIGSRIAPPLIARGRMRVPQIGAG